jgi:predicted metalloprotease
MPWSVGDSARDGAKEKAGGKPSGKHGWLALGGFVLVLAGATIGTLGRDRVMALIPSKAGSNVLEGEAVVPPAQREIAQLTAKIMADVEATWTRDFGRRNQRYTNAEPIAFTQRPPLECEPGASLFASGHCPGTNKVFFDLSFAQALEKRAGASSRYAWAYVVAHEMGHHVQRLIGFDVKVKAALERRPVLDYAIGLSLELQADCFAGVWARQTGKRDLMPVKEMENALRVAGEEGRARYDERTNVSQVETFTYAVSRRRLYWFLKGITDGNILDCDPFKTE